VKTTMIYTHVLTKTSRGLSGQAALRASYAVVPEIGPSGYADKKPHSGAYPETI
jgi:hypothetical protein